MSTGEASAGRSWFPGRRWIHGLRTWWSDSLFPGEPAPPAHGRAVLLCEGLLVLAAGMLFFSQLDSPLQEPEETLYAEVSRQMFAEHRVLVPVRHGQPFYDKPPLLYWMVMGMYRLCGVHDWAARLVPCTAAFFCVLLTYAWGKRTLGPRAAFAGALMLCLSPRFVQFARMVTMNSLLTLCVIAALAAGQRALAGSRLERRWWLLSALACGLGCLAKGPVAIVLTVVPILAHQFFDRRRPRIGARPWLAYAVLVGLLALPWFVILAVRDPGFVYYFVWIHHIRRVLDPIDHLQPCWYYVPLVLVGTLPWSFLLPGLARHLVSRTTPAAQQRSGNLGFVLLAALWSFLFFSAAGCKRPCYILPMLPPLALALGCYLDAACRLGRMRFGHWAWVAGASFVCLLAVSQCLLPWYADKYSVRGRIVPRLEDCSRATPVMCYPHIWDGVTYYLQRSDVHVYRPAQLDDMVAALCTQRESLVVVKEDASLDRFLQALPSSLEFVLCGRQHPVAVGWVRQRAASAAGSATPSSEVVANTATTR